MREFILFIKKLWENKRTRSLSILIMYFFFFIFVFMFISSLNTNVEKSNNKENDSKMEQEDEFYYLNDIKIISYSAYDLSNNIVLDYNTNLINGTIIYKLVKNSTLVSTNYIENSNTYYISVKEYENIVNDSVVDINGNIKIIISSNNIILDFTEYYGYKINIEIGS